MLRGIIFNKVYLGKRLLFFKCFSLTKKKKVFLLFKSLALLPASYSLSYFSVNENPWNLISNLKARDFLLANYTDF